MMRIYLTTQFFSMHCCILYISKKCFHFVLYSYLFLFMFIALYDVAIIIMK